MKLPSLFFPTLALTGLLSHAPSAWPCSLAPAVDGPHLIGVVGPNPLLVATREGSVLSGPLGRTIATQAIAAPAELLGAKNAVGGELRYFRPEAPLAEGEYDWDGGFRFTVSSSAADQIPDLGTRGDLELYLSDGDGSGECGDVSALIIDLLDVPATTDPSARFLVRFERENGEGFSRLVSLSERYEATVRLRFFHSFKETGHLRSEKLCVKVSGVSSTGTVGASLDLGCVDPNDAADERVFRAEGSGCSASGGSTGLSGVWLLVLLLGWLRVRQSQRRGAPA